MIGLGVEDVPELHEDENGEEQRKLLRGEITADMTEFEVAHKIIPERKLRQRINMAMHEILDEAEQHDDEQQAYAKDALIHPFRDNERIARTWFLL